MTAGLVYVGALLSLFAFLSWVLMWRNVVMLGRQTESAPRRPNPGTSSSSRASYSGVFSSCTAMLFRLLLGKRGFMLLILLCCGLILAGAAVSWWCLFWGPGTDITASRLSTGTWSGQQCYLSSELHVVMESRSHRMMMKLKPKCAGTKESKSRKYYMYYKQRKGQRSWHNDSLVIALQPGLQGWDDGSMSSAHCPLVTLLWQGGELEKGKACRVGKSRNGKVLRHCTSTEALAVT